jgi:hypothetical protein
MFKDIEIYSTTGSLLFQTFSASFKEAVARAIRLGIDLFRADFSGKDLSYVDLTDGQLARSDFTRCNLSGSNVQGTDLTYAKLAEAQLSNVKGLEASTLAIVKALFSDQEVLRAYKIVNKKNNEGAFVGGIKYEIGSTYEVPNASTDEKVLCAPGIHLATLNWCKDKYNPKDHRIVVAEFNREDVAVIPTKTEGKFRVKKCKIVEEFCN